MYSRRISIRSAFFNEPSEYHPVVSRTTLIRWVAELIAHEMGWLGPGDADAARWLEAERVVDAQLAWAIGRDDVTDADVSCAVEPALRELPRPPFGWWT